jgi:hypothetical protein
MHGKGIPFLLLFLFKGLCCGRYSACKCLARNILTLPRVHPYSALSPCCLITLSNSHRPRSTVHRPPSELSSKTNAAKIFTLVLLHMQYARYAERNCSSFVPQNQILPFMATPLHLLGKERSSRKEIAHETFAGGLFCDIVVNYPCPFLPFLAFNYCMHSIWYSPGRKEFAW